MSVREDAGARPKQNLRAFDSDGVSAAERLPQAHRDPLDHRYARPASEHVAPHPDGGALPVHDYYNGYYSHYYVHPYYRSCHSTALVVGFGFGVYPWTVGWVPPYRYGWVWVPGYWYWGWWHPGYWGPYTNTVVVERTSYVYVPGWWESETVYVEGHYRTEERADWEWVDGYYLEDGTYVRGHWVPTMDAPEGYVWVPGFFDGETWMEGFWRPEYRTDFRWADGYFDEDGVFHAGYWVPVEDQDGFVWIPGWFDGKAWVEGYWVRDAEAYAEDIADWEPAEGWDDGWEVGSAWGDGVVIENRTESDGGARLARPGPANGDMPLALPVDAVPMELRGTE